MLIIKKTTLLPINCYYGILALAKNEAVLHDFDTPVYGIFGISPNTIASYIQKHNCTKC